MISKGKGDRRRKLVQSFTFLASFQAIMAAGCVPVACEVVPETITLDLVGAAG